MKRINKEVMISTVLCLLPMVFGILVYGKLPDEIPTKWYSDGTVGQYMPKAFTVFGMPVFFAAINGLVHFSINTDPKKQNIGSMVKMIGKWLLPVLAMAAIVDYPSLCVLLFALPERNLMLQEGTVYTAKGCIGSPFWVYSSISFSPEMSGSIIRE